jgi:hypothetical protein
LVLQLKAEIRLGQRDAVPSGKVTTAGGFAQEAVEAGATLQREHVGTNVTPSSGVMELAATVLHPDV